MVDPAEDRVLRAKYLDWCSAKIADRFLELTADQIYELAHTSPGPHAVGAGRSVGSKSEPDPETKRAAVNETVPAAVSHLAPLLDEGAAPTSSRSEAIGLGYRVLVEHVTEALAVTLQLPSFDEWTVAYREAPARFDAELVGFWRRDD